MTNKILLIDDDKELSEELAEVLQDEGYEVSRAYNGRDGEKMAVTSDYDVVLLDLKLPDVSGSEVLNNLKSIKPGCRVIIITGNPVFENNIEEAVSRDEAKKENVYKYADRIIKKPFDIEQLLSAVGELINR